jgi:hypothetical protein
VLKYFSGIHLLQNLMRQVHHQADMYHTYIAIPSPKQKGKSNGSTNYFVSGAALSWKDEASFDGADVVDGDAEPEVRDDLVEEEPLKLSLDGVDEWPAQQVRRHRQVVFDLAEHEHLCAKVADLGFRSCVFKITWVFFLHVYTQNPNN